MTGKLKELAHESGETSQLIAGIRDSANQIWLAGLGAFAKAQKEGTKLFNGLVEEGEDVQKQAKKAAGDAYDEVKARASKSWDQLSWTQIERVFEDRVSKVLHTLSVPTRKDLDTLSHRVAELTSVTKRLSEAMEEPGATRKPRAHEVSKHS
ncbi:MAG: phasin family protein [Roseiarcus sp.]|jgi:poly(hydroxyalkanoate) granule-associated protein